MKKLPFDIEHVFARLSEAVEPFPAAALFALAEEGFNSPFEQLVACIISIRTKDEVTLPCARQFFGVVRTPAEVAALPLTQIEQLLNRSTFYEGKSKQIAEIARIVEHEYGGDLPCDFSLLTSFRGVGPKCASLVLGISCGQPYISVDVHVHRITNRWGYVSTKTPEKTMKALEDKLPKKYWVEINRLLVPFGKHVCAGTNPRCSTCPLLDMCRQVGVRDPR